MQLFLISPYIFFLSSKLNDICQTPCQILYSWFRNRFMVEKNKKKRRLCLQTNINDYLAKFLDKLVSCCCFMESTSLNWSRRALREPARRPDHCEMFYFDYCYCFFSSSVFLFWLRLLFDFFSSEIFFTICVFDPLKLNFFI